jgi:hypothetical protein
VKTACNANNRFLFYTVRAWAALPGEMPPGDEGQLEEGGAADGSSKVTAGFFPALVALAA